MLKIKDLFNVISGNKFDFGKMHYHTNGIAFVSRTSKNNGVVGCVEEVFNKKPFDAGLITVSLGGSVLSSFLQPKPFYTAQNVAVLIPKIKLDVKQKLFYCACINHNRFKYEAFGREANRTLPDLLVPDIPEIPKWVEQIKIPTYYKIKNTITDNCIELKPTNWKPFTYDQLFIINRGKGPRIRNSKEGNTPFVTSISTNNGINSYVDYPPTHPGNTIGVNRNGSVGEAFYHDYSYCSTEDVHILESRMPMNKYIAIFYIALIKKERYRYAYGRKWGIMRMKNSVMNLPVDKKNNPNYQYMEDFVKSLPYSYNLQ